MRAIEGKGTRVIFEFFERDHREIDKIVLDARFHPPQERLRAFEEFDRRLERHIRWEEESLFPALARALPALQQGPLSIMRLEHSQIRAAKTAVLGAMRAGDLEAAKAAEKDLFHILNHHNAKEEQHLYPACDRLLPPEQAGGLIEDLRRETSGA